MMVCFLQLEALAKGGLEWDCIVQWICMVTMGITAL